MAFSKEVLDEILKNSAFARVAAIPYITRNYRNQPRGKLKIK
jgi:hypothetical protein